MVTAAACRSPTSRSSAALLARKRLPPPNARSSIRDRLAKRSQIFDRIEKLGFFGLDAFVIDHPHGVRRHVRRYAAKDGLANAPAFVLGKSKRFVQDLLR